MCNEIIRCRGCPATVRGFLAIILLPFEQHSLRVHMEALVSSSVAGMGLQSTMWTNTVHSKRRTCLYLATYTLHVHDGFVQTPMRFCMPGACSVLSSLRMHVCTADQYVLVFAHVTQSCLQEVYVCVQASWTKCLGGGIVKIQIGEATIDHGVVLSICGRILTMPPPLRNIII